MTVLQSLDLPTTSMPSSALDSLKPPSTAVLSAKGDPTQQPYDDRRLSHEDVHATASLTRGPNLSPTWMSLSHSPSHRRANTEVTPRPAPLPARQRFPEQSKTAEDLDYGYSNGSPESPARKKIEEGAKRLSDWFQGKTEPMDLDATPTTEKRNSTPLSGTAFSPRSPKRNTPPSPLKQVTTPNRFSFFGSKRRDELPEPAEDELLNLDVDAALFPTGSDDLNDQGAFDALRNNAGTVIRRLQAAYQQRTFALHEANADKNEKQEELEETRTRVGNLKMQLDGMAEKVQQNEKAIKAMAEELELEKQLRQQEEEALRSVMLVKPPEDDVTSDSGAESANLRQSSKRTSTFTSDSGFESGDESSADSVFSRREGAIGSPTSTSSTAALSSNISQVALSPLTSNTLQPNNKKESKSAPVQTSAPAPQPTSAYDRVMKGLASTTSSWMGGGASKCNICHGVPPSEAWSVLGVLKEENKGLKTRLGELETVIDDCLGLMGS